MELSRWQRITSILSPVKWSQLNIYPAGSDTDHWHLGLLVHLTTELGQINLSAATHGVKLLEEM